jgi:alpha-glucosidase
VHPELGTLADLDRLVTQAGARGIRILLDLVPNHTSDEHPWFVEARSSRDSPRRDWYVWADPGPDGSPPSGRESAFGGGAWTFDDSTGQYYAHRFHRKQPDLNWLNDEVRAAFDEILRYWFDRGIAGFRIDVAHEIVKHPFEGVDLDATHEVLRRWRRLADGYEERRLLVGETWVMDLEQLARFYGSGEDELHLAFNFPFVFASFEAASMREVVGRTVSLLPEKAWPAWTGSNHDNIRFPTRWCGGDERKVRCALVILLALQGTPFLYYGDEIGMENVSVPDSRVLDVCGRDGERTPMQWSREDGGGFTEPGVEPWLPFGDFRRCNVADQRADRGSVLHLCRDVIALRRESVDLRAGDCTPLAAAAGIWAWRRGEGTVVAVNISDEQAAVELPASAIRIATDRARDGESVGGTLALGPWEAAILTR